jgi:hypothetical protein
MGLGFVVQGSGLRVQGVGFRIWVRTTLGGHMHPQSKCSSMSLYPGPGRRVSRLGFRV